MYVCMYVCMYVDMHRARSHRCQGTGDRGQGQVTQVPGYHLDAMYMQCACAPLRVHAHDVCMRMMHVSQGGVEFTP